MKKLFVLLMAASAVGSAYAQASVGVSIGINQPGVYGRIDIGNLPAPALVLPQPVLIAPPRVVVERQPIYLYVPPVHQREWRVYCGRYNACGQPVYFVQDQWVRERYAEQHPDWDHGRHKGHKGHERREDRRDDRHEDEGHDHGKGHGKGHGHDRKD